VFSHRRVTATRIGVAGVDEARAALALRAQRGTPLQAFTARVGVVCHLPLLDVLAARKPISLLNHFPYVGPKPVLVN
jgi:hypothetical protein